MAYSKKEQETVDQLTLAWKIIRDVLGPEVTHDNAIELEEMMSEDDEKTVTASLRKANDIAKEVFGEVTPAQVLKIYNILPG